MKCSALFVKLSDDQDRVSKRNFSIAVISLRIAVIALFISLSQFEYQVWKDYGSEQGGGGNTLQSPSVTATENAGTAPSAPSKRTSP